MSSELATRLEGFLASQPDAGPGARVEHLRRMAGGASRELWSFDLLRGDGPPLALVLRRDPPGREGDSSDRGLEGAVLRAAEDAGVPVPHVHWICSDASVIGSSFFVMDRIDGETIPRRLLRDEQYAEARRVMTGQLGTILARIHTIDPTRPELAGLGATENPLGFDASSARHQVKQLAAAIRRLAAEPHPVLDLAERWLLERAGDATRQGFVHGDYRVGNVIFGPEGVRSVLDWEICHLGDPVEDLGWLCTKSWRFGGELPVGGIGTREELVKAYVEAGGEPVDPERLAFWEALGNLKVALVWISQSKVFLDGRVPSVELAALGRRTAEPEAELLRIMEESS